MSKDTDADPSGWNRRTVDLRPGKGEMLKPGEMIDIRGTHGLSLQDRKIYNLLIHNAFGPGMAEYGHEWTIPLSELRASHKGNERIAVSIQRLMTTVVTAQLANGKTRRFQLLGGNDMDDEDRADGRLSYSFDRRLVELLRDSKTFGSLQLAVMRAFTSKYALALYEHVAKRVRLEFKRWEEYEVDEFRDVLGVPEGKLSAFGDLKRKAIDPALEEINALADFTAWVETRKTGRKVSHVRIGWKWKSPEASAEAFREVQRPHIGRKARIRGEVEALSEEDGGDAPSPALGSPEWQDCGSLRPIRTIGPDRSLSTKRTKQRLGTNRTVST